MEFKKQANLLPFVGNMWVNIFSPTANFQNAPNKTRCTSPVNLFSLQRKHPHIKHWLPSGRKNTMELSVGGKEAVKCLT